MPLMAKAREGRAIGRRPAPAGQPPSAAHHPGEPHAERRGDEAGQAQARLGHRAHRFQHPAHGPGEEGVGRPFQRERERQGGEEIPQRGAAGAAPSFGAGVPLIEPKKRKNSLSGGPT